MLVFFLAIRYVETQESGKQIALLTNDNFLKVKFQACLWRTEITCPMYHFVEHNKIQDQDVQFWITSFIQNTLCLVTSNEELGLAGQNSESLGLPCQPLYETAQLSYINFQLCLEIKLLKKKETRFIYGQVFSCLLRLTFLEGQLGV